MSNVVTLDQNSNTGSDVLARVKALLEQSTVTQAQIARDRRLRLDRQPVAERQLQGRPTAMVQKLA